MQSLFCRSVTVEISSMFPRSPTRSMERTVPTTTAKITSIHSWITLKYSDIITSVRIVDGILNVSILPEVDASQPVEALLQKPCVVNRTAIDQCEKTFNEMKEAMKIKPCSLVVDF